MRPGHEKEELLLLLDAIDASADLPSRATNAQLLDKAIVSCVLPNEVYDVRKLYEKPPPTEDGKEVPDAVALQCLKEMCVDDEANGQDVQKMEEVLDRRVRNKLEEQRAAARRARRAKAKKRKAFRSSAIKKGKRKASEDGPPGKRRRRQPPQQTPPPVVPPEAPVPSPSPTTSPSPALPAQPPVPQPAEPPPQHVDETPSVPPPPPADDSLIRRAPAQVRHRDWKQYTLPGSENFLRWSVRAGTLSGHCRQPGHGTNCKIDRAVGPDLATAAAPGKGRPLGMVLAWLSQGELFETKEDHEACKKALRRNDGDGFSHRFVARLDFKAVAERDAVAAEVLALDPGDEPEVV